MTEVLSITQPEGNAHLGSTLRRSSSQTSFVLRNPPSYSKSSPNLKSRYAAVGYDTSKLPASLPSSAPSSPRLSAPDFSNQPSYTSTPSSSLSLDDQCGAQEEDITFPSYDDGGYFEGLLDHNPTSSPEPIDPKLITGPPSNPSHIESSDLPSIGGDDTAIRSEPTRHVDYLSHNWKEEDIWSSWRHIVTKRKAYSNSPRLENASWRTWAKSMYRLKTVSPEALNWMKDHDVTWLYGPLQTGKTMSLDAEPTPSASRLSRSNSFASKKPILKKRSLSEAMLQRSLSSSTLMKQATDAVRAQQPDKRMRDRPILGNRVLSDFVTSSEPETPLSKATSNLTSTESSTSTSGLQTPCTKRHIHFSNKVEQCIAINEEGYDQPDYYNAIQDDSDSSEDDMLMMKPVKSTMTAKISAQSTPRTSFSTDGKTIAMLPSTTLNYRGDTPEPAEQKSKQSQRSWNKGSTLSLSPSQQTIRPSVPSSNFLLDDEDEEVDMNWQPSASSGRRDSIYPHHELEMNATDDNDDPEGKGLRRTPSGMFMPYEEEDDYINAGLFGKVVDTVNTAKDIAHVIWNVGWRR